MTKVLKDWSNNSDRVIVPEVSVNMFAGIETKCNESSCIVRMQSEVARFSSGKKFDVCGAVLVRAFEKELHEDNDLLINVFTRVVYRQCLMFVLGEVLAEMHEQQDRLISLPTVILLYEQVKKELGGAQEISRSEILNLVKGLLD